MTAAHGDRRIRVLRLLPDLSAVGGPERRALLWATMIDRDRFDLRVCSLSSGGSVTEGIREAGVEVDCLGLDPSVLNLGTTRRLVRYLARIQPDIVHASIAEANFHGAIAGWIAGVPRCIVEEVSIHQRRLAVRAWIRLALARADLIVGVSDTVCHSLRTDYWVAADRIARVYNPIDQRFVTPADRESRRANTDQFRVLAVGRLSPVKNHGLLVRAIALLRDRGVDLANLQLDIIGDGPEQSSLQRSIDDHGLADRIVLRGRRSDIPECLAAADLFVMPSHYEGFGVALAEAVAMDVPALASNTAGCCEILAPAPDRLLPPTDAAAWANAIERDLAAHRAGSLARRQQATRLGIRARELFDPARHFSRWQETYERLCLHRD